MYEKFLFDFYPTELVNTKTTIPPQGQFIALDIYLYSPPLRGIVV